MNICSDKTSKGYSRFKQNGGEHMRNSACLFLCLILSVVIAGSLSSCATPPTTPTDTDSETTPINADEENLPFSLAVLPQELKGFSIPGQRCVFLISVKDEGQASQHPVVITAAASDAQVIVEHDTVFPDQLSEVTVIPNPGSEGKTVIVTITGKRGQVENKATVSFEVIEGEDDRLETAVELRQTFVSWLAEEHPELGLSDETEWTGTMVSPQWLVVSHYLFFSDEWEMHVYWHIMIAPDDWGRIDLRKRFVDTSPGYAFEISSREADGEPVSIEVPDEVWR